LSIVCHLLSVLLLHSLSTTVFSKAPQGISSVPVAVAALHIINPAGAILSSPYSEALFSCLNILGFQLYLGGLRNHYRRRNPRAEIQCLAAGAVLGFATTVRSNGLLSGALFFYDATATAISLVKGDLSIEKFRRLIVIGIGGCLIALGAIIPQYRVYASYCILEDGSETRPWCDDYVPSIYAWVQRHYWYEAQTVLVTSDH
jgi:GPI mannosyltransferase 2